MRFTTTLTLVATLTGCAAHESGDPLLPHDLAPPVTASFVVSELAAATGSAVTLALRTNEPALAGVQGVIEWDPSTLRYIGQIADERTLVVANTERVADGRLVLVALDLTGLEQAGVFAFEALRSGYATALEFTPSIGVDLLGRDSGVRFEPQLRVAQLPPSDSARRMGFDDWAALLGVGPLGARPAALPGAAELFGDGTEDGAINVLDAVYAANLAVGNPGFECIVGTDAPGRDCTAINVRPQNAPGLGEPGDDCPPGVEICGGSDRTVNVLDVLAIRLEAVGVDQAVVGEMVPKLPVTSTDTVVIQGPLTVAGTRVFSADSLYILRGGPLIVGDELGSAGEVVFEPGSRFESDTSSAILITRNGRIIADGTTTRPITFTCEARVGAPRGPLCWGGLFIFGNAVLNDGGGGPAAPQIPGRNPGGGKQRSQWGGSFGGLNDADSSGVLRYVRVAYAGNSPTGQESSNITIGACGAGTVLSHVQVHGGSDDGLEIVGGRCNIHYLFATANGDDALDVGFGWDGTSQYQVLQVESTASPGGDRGQEVDNTENVITYDAQPRTAPEIWNVTLVGGTTVEESGGAAPPPATRTAIKYRRGAGGTLTNFLFVQWATAVELDDAETCSLLGQAAPSDRFVVESSVALGVGASSASNTCLAQLQTYLAPPRFGDAPWADQLVAPFARRYPDFRPVGTGITSVQNVFPSVPPPPFDPTSAYFGGVAPVQWGTGASIPWYSGWTMGWQTTSIP